MLESGWEQEYHSPFWTRAKNRDTLFCCPEWHLLVSSSSRHNCKTFLPFALNICRELVCKYMQETEKPVSHTSLCGTRASGKSLASGRKKRLRTGEMERNGNNVIFYLFEERTCFPNPKCRVRNSLILPKMEPIFQFKEWRQCSNRKTKWNNSSAQLHTNLHSKRPGAIAKRSVAPFQHWVYFKNK